MSLDDWLAYLPKQAADAPLATELAEHLRSTIAPPPKRAAKKPEASLTFRYTSRRKFEVDYWNMIAALSTGQYVNKDNADCVDDPVTQALLAHPHRDLEALGDYVLDYYRGVVKQAGMTRTAAGRRSAVQVADRFRLCLVRRLAAEPPTADARSAT